MLLGVPGVSYGATLVAVDLAPWLRKTMEKSLQLATTICCSRNEILKRGNVGKWWHSQTFLDIYMAIPAMPSNKQMLLWFSDLALPQLPWFLEGYVHAFINPLHVFVTCYLSTTWVLPQTIWCVTVPWHVNASRDQDHSFKLFVGIHFLQRVLFK